MEGIKPIKIGGGGGSLSYASAGCLIIPAYEDRGAGRVIVSSVDVALFDNPTFEGSAKKYTLEMVDWTLDEGINYIVGDYNGGTPAFAIYKDQSLINESNLIPVLTIINTGGTLHTINWNDLGLGLANKIHQSIVFTQRYRRKDGLAISVSGTRNVDLTGGTVYIGANKVVLQNIASATDKLTFYKHVAGAWVADYTVTQFNNNQYDNGTNLVELTANRYTVNWLYRGIEGQEHLYLILGNGDYTLKQAQDAQPTVPPAIVSAHAMLVAKIIAQKGIDTPVEVNSAFDVEFGMQAPTNHNDLAYLQGGEPGEYYHLTEEEHASLGGGGVSLPVADYRGGAGNDDALIYLANEATKNVAPLSGVTIIDAPTNNSNIEGFSAQNANGLGLGFDGKVEFNCITGMTRWWDGSGIVYVAVGGELSSDGVASAMSIGFFVKTVAGTHTCGVFHKGETQHETLLGDLMLLQTASKLSFVHTPGVDIKFYRNDILIATHTEDLPTGNMNSPVWKYGIKGKISSAYGQVSMGPLKLSI